MARCTIISALVVGIVMNSVIVNSQASVQVPALLWSPERSMSDITNLDGGNAVQAEDFLKSYLTPLMTGSSLNGVIFVQDKLHTDDFTRFADVYSLESDGGAFRNIKGLMDEHFSLELPQVTDPLHAIDKLKASFSGDIHHVSTLEDVEGLNLKTDKKFLLIVQLSPVADEADQEKAIQENDATVGKISSHLQKRGIKYAALFTGKTASESESDTAASYLNRHLMATVSDGSNNGTFLNVSNGNIYIFLREIYVCVKNESEGFKYCPLNVTLTPDEDTASNSTWSNNTAVIELGFTNVNANLSTKPFDIKIVIEAYNLGDKWIMNRTALFVSGGENDKYNMDNATLTTGEDVDLVVPILYSYHCSDYRMKVDALHDVANKDFKGTYIRIKGYQIQPFNIHNDQFLNSHDCVVFFTTPIAMAIFTSIILLLILLFGTMMVLNLSIMDKYDDPKGKTITVAQGSD